MEPSMREEPARRFEEEVERTLQLLMPVLQPLLTNLNMDFRVYIARDEVPFYMSMLVINNYDAVLPLVNDNRVDCTLEEVTRFLQTYLSKALLQRQGGVPKGVLTFPKVAPSVRVGQAGSSETETLLGCVATIVAVSPDAQVGSAVRPAFWHNPAWVLNLLELMCHDLRDPVIWAVGWYDGVGVAFLSSSPYLAGSPVVPTPHTGGRPQERVPVILRLETPAQLLTERGLLLLPHDIRRGDSGAKLLIFERAEEPIELYTLWREGGLSCLFGMEKQLHLNLLFAKEEPVLPVFSGLLAPYRKGLEDHIVVFSKHVGAEEVLKRLASLLRLPYLSWDCTEKEFGLWLIRHELPPELNRQLGMA
jgi:hypothetical protein